MIINLTIKQNILSNSNLTPKNSKFGLLLNMCFKDIG